ncbi:MAG: Ig-like domain-containing domain, partial [Planctomycetota bacterium]
MIRPNPLLALSLLATLTACSLSDETGPTPIAEPAVGQVNAKPDGGGNGFYIVDPHDAGQAGAVFITDIYTGRLVTVYDRNPVLGNPQNIDEVYRDFVIGEDVTTEPGKWTLDTNPVTGEQRLIIEEPPANIQNLFNGSFPGDAADGSPFSQFDELIAESQENLSTVIDKSLAVGTSPPFSLVPRNAAMVVQFSDLIDVNSVVLQDSVQVVVGSPPVNPQEVRLIPDPNHGGLNPVTGAFTPTRLVIDFTINSLEQQGSGSALQLNGLGLPASLGVNQANVGLRFPTEANAAFGQFGFLKNLSGSALSQTDNGSFINGTTLDIVRAVRSGNSGDLNNGFLVDGEAPTLIGVQRVSVNSAADAEVPGEYVLTYTYESPVCATDPIPGDVIEANGQFLEVVDPGAVSAGVVSSLRVRVPGGTEAANLPTAASLLGAASFQTAFRTELLSVVNTACFVRFAPEAAILPDQDVPSNARVLLRFSEAIDPAGLSAFDTFTVSRTAAVSVPDNFRDRVLGRVEVSGDLVEASFIPTLPFAHEGSDTNYFLNVASQLGEGVRDLAGNPLELTLPEIAFQVNGDGEDPVRNAAWSLDFADLDVDGNAGFDLVGQFLFQSESESIVPRPVSRFSQVADRQNPILGAMTAVTPGLQTPLSDLGSKLHLMWRYADVGLGVSDTDPSFVNIDVEGVALAPANGQVTPAFYPEFEMKLGHARPMPDEIIDPLSGAPIFPNSGFLSTWTFDQNYLPDPNSTVATVHKRQDGFSVSSLGLFTAPETDTPMLAMPMNQNLPLSEFETYTWRDTAILGLGGLSSNGITSSANGVPFDSEVNNGLTDDCYGGVYGTIFLPPDFQGIRSIGLPLLMEFSCFPSNTVSLNTFDVSQAVQNFNSPFFRAFSTGGFDANGNAIKKDPDNQPSPTGGFNGVAGGAIPLGAATDPRDNTVYLGQLDLVIRISRAYTVMIDSGNDLPDYAEVVLEPAPAEQPDGTSVQLAYRGHAAATGPLDPRFLDGGLLSVYGDISYAPLILPPLCEAPDPEAAPEIFDPSVPVWSEDLDDIDLLKFSQ